MINIALYQPKIPPNTGNIIRFCANTGIKLHLIHPLGFVWDDKQLRRAGLDYEEYADITHHVDWNAFLYNTKQFRKFIITTKGSKSAFSIKFSEHDYLILGSEDAGIERKHMLEIENSNWLRLPMQDNSRSMNLSNTAAIIGYEALRQIGFIGLN